MIIRLYSILLKLYPRQFRATFGDEMQTVFAEAASNRHSRGIGATLVLCELRDLPGSLLNAYADHWFHGENMSTQDEFVSPATPWQAFVGALPFLAFGAASMIGKVDHIYHFRGYYADLGFYLLALVGLLIGWIRGFPLWSYSYLGWTLVFAWSWTNTSVAGFDLGYRAWIPLGIVIVIALLWTRSLEALKKMAGGIWNDLTRLSLAMYAFPAWAILIYDENHHP